MPTNHVSKGGYKEVWLLAYPNMVTMLLHNCMSIVDTLMIGMVGTAALAGVGLAQLVLATLFYLYKGLADGVLTWTAQYVGAQQDDRCGAVAWQGLYMGGIMTLLILLLIPLVEPLFQLMQPAADTMAPGIAYLRVALIGESLGPLTLTLIYFLRGLGDTKTPMYIGLVGNGLNVVGNYVLIYGHAGVPPLGVVGAALSTTVAEGVVFGLLLWVFLGRRIASRYATRRVVMPARTDVQRLLRLALPLSIQGLLEVGGFTLFSVMIGRMGTVQLALNHIILRFIVFAFLPVHGLAVAASTLVGQYLGAADRAGAAESGRHALHLGVWYMGGLGLLFVCIPQVFLSIFTSDPHVMALGTILLRLVGLVQAGDALYWVCGGVLKGAGDTRWIMVTSVVYNWLVFLPLAFLWGVVYEGGIIGAWSSFAVTVLLQGCTFWVRFHRGHWQALSLISPEPCHSRDRAAAEHLEGDQEFATRDNALQHRPGPLQ
jgi:MATE family multidrug resistance protein